MSDVTTPEEWLDVAGYEGVYQVSDAGNVRRAVAGYDGRARVGRLSPGRTSSGHLLVALFKDGSKQQVHVHRLVASAFHGPQPSPAHLVCHNNGDPSDNRASNLRWGTQSDNIHDSVTHGTHRNSRKTECLRGHPLSGSNLYQRKSGRRECRTCIRARKLQSLTGL